MKATKIFLILFLFFFLDNLQACQCPSTVLSLEECAKYEIIFAGKVESVKPSDNKYSEVEFTVLELYKGSIKERFTILFDSKDPCAQQFRAGEEWIIYSRFKQVTNGVMEWCSRSRKYFTIAKQDFYTENLGNDYDTEIQFLRQKLGEHRPVSAKKEASNHTNEKPSLTQTIIILIVSMSFMILFYWFFGKYFKRF